MIPASVEYARAADLENALELLADPEARAIAGGQSLLPVMKLRVARPSRVVDLQRLPLRGIDTGGDVERIGALTTWDELVNTTELDRPAYAAVRECARGIGDLQVRNRGTIGGSLAHADPASDMPAVLLALGATVVLRSASGEREIAVDELLAGPFTTTLEPAELITEVVVPAAAPGSGSAYASVEHPASGFPLAGAAAVVQGDGDSRVAFTGIAERPFLAGGPLEETLERIEVFGDRFASAAYRLHLAAVVARRALELAEARAAEDAA